MSLNNIVNFFLVTLYILLLSGCSLLFHSGKSSKGNIGGRYEVIDKNGKFILERRVGLEKKMVVVEEEILSNEYDEQGPLETKITYSTPGKINKKLSILRPTFSKYIGWFEKEKYITVMRTRPKKKAILVKYKGPSPELTGRKLIPFPRKGKGVFCFFSNLIECVRKTGFFEKAKIAKAGTMNFYVIWEGYPFYQFQFENFENKVFGQATLNYLEKDKKGRFKYGLQVNDQEVIYFLDGNFNFLNKYWVSQGLSVRKLDEN